MSNLFKTDYSLKVLSKNVNTSFSNTNELYYICKLSSPKFQSIFKFSLKLVESNQIRVSIHQLKDENSEKGQSILESDVMIVKKTLKSSGDLYANKSRSYKYTLSIEKLFIMLYSSEESFMNYQIDDMLFFKLIAQCLHFNLKFAGDFGNKENDIVPNDVEVKFSIFKDIFCDMIDFYSINETTPRIINKKNIYEPKEEVEEFIEYISVNYTTFIFTRSVIQGTKNMYIDFSKLSDNQYEYGNYIASEKVSNMNIILDYVNDMEDKDKTLKSSFLYLMSFYS